MRGYSCVSAESFQVFVPESAQVGKPVGKIKAEDKDVGVNAEIKYSIINQEGANVFSIATDKDTREGVISLKKVLGHISKYVSFLYFAVLKTTQTPSKHYINKIVFFIV